MNDIRIREYVDEIFKDVKMTGTALDQKEELTVNLTERVRDYMREGLSFDTAFETAKNVVGDTDELTAPFEKMSFAGRSNGPDETDDQTHAPTRKKASGHSVNNWQLAALSPFIYLFLGFMFGWWAWAWVIIPVAGIIGAPIPSWTKLVALSPFIYVLLGFFFGWWAWAWIIIPVAGILSTRDKFAG